MFNLNILQDSNANQDKISPSAKHAKAKVGDVVHHFAYEEIIPGKVIEQV